MRTNTALTSCETRSSVQGGEQQQALKSSTSLKQTITSKFKPKSFNINQSNESKATNQRKQRTICSPKHQIQQDVVEKNQIIIDTDNDDIRCKQQTINYWHYKQTGIKSRPIKLIKHPIEHIERKIIISYLLGFLFKLIAISTGPLIVLFAYLFTSPFIAVRRSIWFLLNLKFLTDLKIKTRKLTPDELSKIDNSCSCLNKETKKCHHEAGEKITKLKKQLFWNYCPLTFIETYWFKEKLVNNVILVIDNNDKENEFSIVKLKHLVKENILSKPSYRKFLSLVITKGFPFYKSYYWRYLGLVHENGDALSQMSESNLDPKFNDTKVDGSNTHSTSHNLQLLDAREQQHQPLADSSSIITINSNISDGQFSVSSPDSAIYSNNAPAQEENCKENVVVPMSQSLIEENLDKVYLDNHIYLDENLHKSKVTCSSIRRYTYNLLNVSLSLTRPLWEIRVIPATNGKTYLIFRCHQCLADGRSLTNILTDHLTSQPAFESFQSSGMKSVDDLNISSFPNFDQSPETIASTTASTTIITQQSNQKEQQDTIDDGEDESELKPIKAKRSFISRVSRANSIRSAVFVGPLTVLLWVIWTFTRRKNNHLNKCLPVKYRKLSNIAFSSTKAAQVDCFDQRRFYMTHYSLTKFHQIKQMTRSTVSDVILCALSGALRDYLRNFNGVSNPPNLNASLTVDMRQPGCNNNNASNRNERGFERNTSPSNDQHTTRTTSSMTNEVPSSVYSDDFPSSTKKQSYPRNEPEVNCTLVNVPLATSIEGTVPRLWEIRGTMDELRTSADPWVMLGLQQFLFAILPSTWYQRVINYIALRNSSTFVSNIHGPVNMVESWCVDLLQRALFQAQQSAQMQKYQLHSVNETGSGEGEKSDKRPLESRRSKLKWNKATRLNFLSNLGSLSSIYYCMQPPTSNIPISFNCITYHNKLFVTSLSRSLLVEDSKLLIRLFFKQLNQLADTIAKRRSLVTIIRTPIPIEISCQPASPVLDDKSSASIDFAQVDYNYNNIPDDEEEEQEEEKMAPIKSRSSHLFGFHKDDIEANVGTSGRTNRCSTCNQTACTCQRRKSLFSFDYSKQRAVNLVNLLHPSNSKLSRSSNINNNCETVETQETSTTTNECICGRKLLEELDEEDDGGPNSEIEDKDLSSAGSQTPSESYSKARRMSASRPYCAKCRTISHRSTLSLNTAPEKQKKHRSNLTQNIHDHSNSSVDRSDPNIGGGKEMVNTSAQLIIPDGDRANTKLHSKSETDLRPMNKDVTQRGSKESWFMLGRKGNRKLSLFSRSSSSNQQNPSPPGPLLNSNERIDNTATSRTFFIENPVELIYKHLGGTAKRRRQSLATGTATTQMQKAIVVKDEINADVSLRYQLDGPFIGIRNRRSSNAGPATGAQRRSSLIPFGLMQNSSLPKLYWDDGEAHL